MGLIGGNGVQDTKFILFSGLFPKILLTLPSNSGVSLSIIGKALRASYNWATVLAPINAESRCLNLIAQAKAKWIREHSN